LDKAFLEHLEEKKQEALKRKTKLRKYLNVLNTQREQYRKRYQSRDVIIKNQKKYQDIFEVQQKKM